MKFNLKASYFAPMYMFLCFQYLTLRNKENVEEHGDPWAYDDHNGDGDPLHPASFYLGHFMIMMMKMLSLITSTSYFVVVVTCGIIRRKILTTVYDCFISVGKLWGLSGHWHS